MKHWFFSGLRGKELGWRAGRGEIRPGDHVLLFYGRRDRSQSDPVGAYINLTAPDTSMTAAAYDNACRKLTDGTEILGLVRSRIRDGYTKKQRGLLVTFTARPQPFDTHWDFVITADPENKSRVIEELKSWRKEEAICNLVSYPGEETVRLLRPLLNDPTTAESFESDGAKRKNVRRWYPVRQAAYLALTLLGEKVERPKPYYPDLMSWGFGTGLDDAYDYPSGRWKRLPDE
jgi:hypothetical protein